MDTLTLFVNDISEFKINLPLWFKIGILLVLIVSLLVGGYFIQSTFDISYLKNGFNWYIIVALINLISILLIYYYYNDKNTKYVGGRGVKGIKGKRGKKGTSVSCSYNCKKNIYIQTVRKTDKIATLSVYNENFNSLNTTYKYFENLISSGTNIDYDSFLKNILINNIENEATNKYKSLLTTNAITILLIKHINREATMASTHTYGTFRSPVPKVGYIAIGNSVYGGVEEKGQSNSKSLSFNLKSFVVSGNIMYPAGYNKLVSFKSYNENTEDYDMYTIWKPIAQTVNDPTFGGGTEQHSYLSLGDVCSFSNKPPKINDFALIKEDCLEPVTNIMDLRLIFIYVGDFEINNTTSNTTSLRSSINSQIDYTQSDSYLIKNKLVKDIEIFSVFRTPMNTFITKSNADNNLVNNTLMYNILNGIDGALNEYGNINNESKKMVQDLLKLAVLPQFMAAMIYTKHLMIDSRKDLIYYINKYQTQVPEFKEISMLLNTYEIYDLLKIVKDTISKYDKFNADLVKNTSISLRSDKVLDTKTLIVEKKLPTIIVNTYNNIIDKINTLPVQIENSNTMLDIVNYVIPNGLNGRIAIDSNGIIEGGFFLNEIQDIIVRLCIIIFPPNRLAYTIKDECLGTFVRDNKREEIIREFTDEKYIYNKCIDEIKNNSDKYKSHLAMIKTYEDMSILKIGQLVGHISGYMDKVHNADLDEFTTNRIQGIIKIYQEINSYLVSIV